jgi:hypothetical protein
MKSFRTYLQEGAARKEHSTMEFRLLKTHGNAKMVFAGNEWVATIDHIPGVPEMPQNKDQYIASYNGQYRDSRLKIHRPTSRRIGSFDSEEKALSAIKAAIQNLRK